MKRRELPFEEEVVPIPKPWVCFELATHPLGGLIEEGATVKFVIQGKNGVTHIMRAVEAKVGWPHRPRTDNPKIDWGRE